MMKLANIYTGRKNGFSQFCKLGKCSAIQGSKFALAKLMETRAFVPGVFTRICDVNVIFAFKFTFHQGKYESSTYIRHTFA